MKWLALAAVLAGMCCEGCPRPGPAPVTPAALGDAGAGWDGATPATCLDVCRHEAALGCPAAEPTPAGATCLDVCLNYQNTEIAPWDLNCRARAPSCSAIDACQ